MEQCFFGIENLECRGRVFGKVGERISVGDEVGGDRGVDEGLQVGCNIVEFFVQVVGGGFVVFGLFDDSLGEVEYDFEIGGGDVQIYGDFGGVNDGLSFFIIFIDNGGDVVEFFIGKGFFVINGEDEFSVGEVVGFDFDQFREVLVVLFMNMYEELVDVFVLEVDGGVSLDNVVVVVGNVEFDFGVGVGVVYIKIGFFDIVSFEVF